MTPLNDDVPRDENGRPMLYPSKPEDSDSFHIDDRSPENEQKAVAQLKKEFGSNYDSALKNARKVLSYADSEYGKSLEEKGLGNWPPLIKALNKLGKDLEVKFREANQSGAVRDASLKAFKKTAREKVNHLITKLEAEYIAKQGSINR